MSVDEQWTEFHRLVNMPSPELRAWLLSAPGIDDAYAPRPGVDVVALGYRVYDVLGKRHGDLNDGDRALMGEVTDLIREMLANPPAGGAADNPWRHGLMSLGHDPLRPDSTERSS